MSSALFANRTDLLSYRIGKRIFDALLALIGLTLLSPLLLFVALTIKLSSPGPVFFRQQRVGQAGRLFKIIKFRTMYSDHGNSSPITTASDTRITPLGRILRRYKIDELPQLWNVLKGDMSLVGPRPDVPGYADLLEGDDRRILFLKPGITGPATLKYRDEEQLLAQVADPTTYNDEVIFPDKVKENLHYLEHWSFRLDLALIVRTLSN